MYNERALPAFYFRSFITFNIASVNTTRLTLSFHLSFKKITVALAKFPAYKPATYLEVSYFMWCKADK